MNSDHYNSECFAVAKKNKLPVIELRAIFNKKVDYANPIEPGVPGGDKLTSAIIKVIEEHDFSKNFHQIYAGKLHGNLPLSLLRLT